MPVEPISYRHCERSHIPSGLAGNNRGPCRAAVCAIPESNPNSHAVIDADPKNVITWVLILIVPLVAVVAVTGLLNLMQPGLMREVSREHFAAVVGLRHSEGPIKFDGVGMKFEGASGQVTLWVMCFWQLLLRYGLFGSGRQLSPGAQLQNAVVRLR